MLSVVLSDCCKPMNNFWDWAFSNSGLEVGLPAFQLPTFAKCDAVPNEICGTCLFQESIPAIPFWNSKRPLPTRSLNTSSALWLHHARPFVASAEKNSLMQRSRGFGHGVVVSKICYNAVIVLSVALWDCCKPTNTCRDWVFSKWGYQPFSCRCPKTVTHCRKEICSTCLLHYGIMPIPLLQLQEKHVLCREAEGLVTELWSPRFVTMQWLCS